MKTNAPETLIFVLYDGIDNSVFDGQVIEPLLKHKRQFPQKKIILISFERTAPSAERIQKKIPAGITFIVLKKFPFFGTITLLPALLQLKKAIHTHTNYCLIARGPLAGYLCLKAIRFADCTQLTIQARGLLVEEYLYTHTATTPLKKLWHKWRAQLYHTIERAAFAPQCTVVPVVIEAVSNALKEYLIQKYNCTANAITIAHHDLPPAFDATTIAQWRTATRTELCIAHNAYVYCYNGSVKPWQCPEQTIEFFKKELASNKNSFLLVLTMDTQQFKQLCIKHKLNAQHYTILCVKHNDIYRYLAACDVGTVFREKSILNWISRPTKILEYKAVGLTIAHNNTVAMLLEE